MKIKFRIQVDKIDLTTEPVTLPDHPKVIYAFLRMEQALNEEGGIRVHVLQVGEDE